MSVQATTWVWEHSEAKGNERLVLLAIADAANKQGGKSYQSAATIASMTRISARTVQRVIARLVESGELVREDRKGPHGTISYALPMADRPTSFCRTSERRTTNSAPSYDKSGPQLRHLGVVQPHNPSTPTEYTPEGARKRAARLPEGWMPEQRVIEHMRSECPGVNLEAEHRKFADHWAAESGEKASKLDWNAAWRNWIRRAAAHDQRANTYTPSWQKRLDANIQAAQADMTRDRGVFEIGE